MCQGGSRNIVRRVAVLLALLAAAAYGAGDFAAGLASRRLAAGPVSATTQGMALVAALIALVILPGHSPGPRELWWGVAGGVGSGVGSIALYAGLARGQMSIAATLSAVLAAIVPALVGVALGDRLSVPATIGIIVAVPAIVMVAWQREDSDRAAVRAALGYGGLAGLGFALLFVALARAGTRAGAWPLVFGEVAALLIVVPVAWRGMRGRRRPAARTLTLALVAGALGGAASLLYLASTGHGELAVVAVVTSLYPAVTILLARMVVGESWSRIQAVGLLIAAAAVALVSAG